MIGITIREAARLLGLAPGTLTSQVSKGRLAYLPREQWPDLRSPRLTPESVEQYRRTIKRGGKNGFREWFEATYDAVKT